MQAGSIARLWGRQRQTGSLCIRSDRLLRTVIARAQRGRLGPYVTPQTFELSSGPDRLSSAQREYDDGPRFFANFDDAADDRRLAGRKVLDLGCGYGGRTVYYAERCAAAHVTGIEISAEVVDRCRRFAKARDVENVGFEVAFAEELPFSDSSFEAVVSYDVLEHVADPVKAISEISRVLEPGGDAWLVFPTYLGARASHLDYLTQIPALHRLFDPDTIIGVVNEFLAADRDRLGVAPQPFPQVGALGRRALPLVNGMSRSEAELILAAVDLHFDLCAAPILTPRAGLLGAAQVHGVLALW